MSTTAVANMRIKHPRSSRASTCGRRSLIPNELPHCSQARIAKCRVNKKTSGGARTHTVHTGALGHTDHTDEPHKHPNPTTHPHDHATAETAADSTAAAPQARSRPLPAADSEEAAPSEPDPASTRSQSASPRLLEGGRRNEGARGKRVYRYRTNTGKTLVLDFQRVPVYAVSSLSNLELVHFLFRVVQVLPNFRRSQEIVTCAHMVGVVGGLASALALVRPRCLPPRAGIVSWANAAEREGIVFVGSYVRVQDMPSLRLPEFTLAGRSNVGKSSALNTLAGRPNKKIAKVSKTPGSTRLINLYRLGNVCTITDLPGYGYAKVSMEMQDDWRKQIEAYMRRREELKLAVLFVDAQRDPQETDAQLLDFLEAEAKSTLVVATKADKLAKQALQSSLEYLRESLALPSDQPIALSSVTGLGKREVWGAINEICTRSATSEGEG